MATTIVDSNVIIDLVEPDSEWADWSQQRITDAKLEGDIVYNVVIAAEVAHQFESRTRYEAVFSSSLWRFQDIPAAAALSAGWVHRTYRQRGGTRERTLPDFLIGAHASLCGHRLLTRDPTRYRTYFPDLDVISPDTHPLEAGR